MTDCRVQLRHATLPPPLGWLAVHGWFAVYDAGCWHRWEVWQRRDAGGTSWGYLHRDLMPADADVGGGPCVVEREWQGVEAARLEAVLTAPERYPYRQRYRMWPGPNSNSYVAWVLRQAGIDHRLGHKAIGRHFS